MLLGEQFDLEGLLEGSRSPGCLDLSLRTSDLGSSAGGEGAGSCPAPPTASGDKADGGRRSPLQSGARRGCAAASRPASAAVQLLARPSESGLRLRGEWRAWGALPLVCWWVGQGSRVGGGVHWVLGSGRQLQRRRVGATTARTGHPGVQAGGQPQGQDPSGGHRPALTLGLDAGAAAQDVGATGLVPEPRLGEWPLKLRPRAGSSTLCWAGG